MSARATWVWMPHAAHFICSHDCRFHLATCVGRYIVSTVGEYWPDRVSREIHAQVHDLKWLEENRHLKGDYFDRAYMERFGFENIGLDRKYETMVFPAAPAADECCPWRIDVSHQRDFDSYNDAGAAYKGHMRLCEKWASRT